MHDIMRFRLRRGVDGFRVDAAWCLIKDDQFRDNPLNHNFRRGGLPRDPLIPLYTVDLSEVHDAISGMRRVLDESPNRVRRKHVTLAEGSYEPLMASGDLLFYRELRDERVWIALNMRPEPIAVSFPDKKSSGRRL